METGQRDKKNDYIAGTLGILAILLLIALSHTTYFEKEVKKDNVYLALSNVQKGKSTPKKSEVHDVVPPKQCAIDVNAMCGLGVIGVYYWFNRNYIAQLIAHYTSEQYLKEQVEFNLELEYAHYILAGVVWVAMAVYICYFVSQNYSFDLTIAKDMGILFLGMPLFFVIIMHVMQMAQSDTLSIWLYLCTILIFYTLARDLLKKSLYNNKLVLLNQGWFVHMQRLVLSGILVDLYYKIHMECTKCNSLILHIPLWASPIAFFYVQNYWSPQLSFSSGYEKIDDWIAWRPFWTMDIWLASVLMVLYDNGQKVANAENSRVYPAYLGANRFVPSGTWLIGAVLVWLCISTIYTWWFPAEKATTDSQQA